MCVGGGSQPVVAVGTFVWARLLQDGRQDSIFFGDVSNLTASGAADEAGFDVPEHMQGLVSAVPTTNAIAVCCACPRT